MFLKSKIGLTILSLYEIAAVLLLHCPRTCDAMFGASFCDDHIFKYFIACIVVPLVVFLLVMWIMDIVHRIRRHRSLLYKTRHAVQNMAMNIRDRISEKVSSGDIEKMITAALVIGLKKYSDRNPRARQILGQIFWCRMSDLNQRPTDYKSAALPTELIRQRELLYMFVAQISSRKIHNLLAKCNFA